MHYAKIHNFKTNEELWLGIDTAPKRPRPESFRNPVGLTLEELAIVIPFFIREYRPHGWQITFTTNHC